MVAWIKSFRLMVSEPLQLVLAGVIAIYTLAFRINYTAGLFPIIGNLITILLLLAAVGLLIYYKKSLAAHAILLLGMYIGGLTAFINVLFSLSFNPLRYAPAFTPELFVNLIIFLYLLLMVVSYMLAGNIKLNPLKGKVLMYACLLFVFIWIFNGFYSAFTTLVLTLVALFIGTEFSALVLILSAIIVEPFFFINTAINGFLGTRPLNYYLYVIGLLGFIVIFILELYKRMQNKSLNV